MDTRAAAGADAAGCEHTGGLLKDGIWLYGMGQDREQTSPLAGEEGEEGHPSQSRGRIKLHLKVSLGCSHAGNQREAGRAPASAHHSILASVSYVMYMI